MRQALEDLLLKKVSAQGQEVASITEDPSVTVAAFGFPFSIPFDLLQSATFAGRVEANAFGTRANWAQFVEPLVGLAFASDNADAKIRLDPVLQRWKDKAFWTKRATDVATNAQPPLKHMFQSLFNMTVVGSRFLRRLCSVGMQIVLTPAKSMRAADRLVIETYPGAVAARVGFKGSYKQKPGGGLEAAEEYLDAQGIILDFDQEVRRFCLKYRTLQMTPTARMRFCAFGGHMLSRGPVRVAQR